MNTLELLRELSESAGVSGYERVAREATRRAFLPYVDDLRVDALGNLIARKEGSPSPDGPRRAILVAAHSDEIGLMVKGFDKGFLRFATVGGVDLRTILGQEVVVHGRRDLPGIVASRPPHVLPPDQRKKTVPLDDLFIDVGFSGDSVRDIVSVGDLVTMRRDLVELAEGYVCGKAFDDRAGIVSLAVCLEALSGPSGAGQHLWDVYAVATSQEEVGLKGATVSAYGVAPDVAIAVDVTFGAQQGVAEAKTVDMDGGPAIARGPNVHPKMHERLVEIASQYELKHQIEVVPGASGTDAWAIQVARDGIPTALLSIPLRYMHTSVETVCLKDIERTGRLLALFIAGLGEPFHESLYS
jgi:endoglucanase